MAINQITIEINNQTFTGWESVEIYDDMEQLGNNFTLTTNIPADINLVVKKGQSVIIKIDGETLLTGYVDRVRKKEDANSSQVTVTGRDKVSDFVDSKVSNKTFTPPIGFVEILKKLLIKVGYEIVSPNSLSQPLQADLAINKIGIINNYVNGGGTIADFQTSEGIGFSAGESAYELIKRLADKRGLILGTDGKGNITIDDVGAKTAITTLQRLQDDSGTVSNNIKDADLDDGMESLFYSYTIASKSTGATNATLSATNKGKSDAEKAILDPIGSDSSVTYSATVYDKTIRPTRNFYAVIPNLNNAQCKDRAIWECNIRKAKSFVYTCRVAGFRQNAITPLGNNKLNPLWDINMKVFLIDERYNLKREFLIRAVRYKQSVSEGSICELTLIDQNSYTYSLFEPLIKRGKKSKNNANLLFNDPV